MRVASTARRGVKPLYPLLCPIFPSANAPASVSIDASYRSVLRPPISLVRARSAVRLGIRARICALVAPLQPCGTNRCSVDAVEAASHCS